MKILNKYIYIYSAYKRGYEEARFWRDSINFQHLLSKTRRGRVGKDIAQTLDTGCEQGIAVPVLTPDRAVKKQNGRRIKDDGDPAFTVTTEPNGVAIGNGIDTVYYPKRDCYIAIRKLTPKECFRLQGFSDDLFSKAQFVNSDSQLYKQAGNAVTVNAAEAVGRAIADNDIQTKD